MPTRPITGPLTRSPSGGVTGVGVGGGLAAVRSMFSEGEDGGIYSVDDLSKLWQDTAGTTSVTTVGQTVRRIDDQSGNGLHLANATGWVLSQDTEGCYYLAASGASAFTGAVSWAGAALTVACAYNTDGTQVASEFIAGIGNTGSGTIYGGIRSQNTSGIPEMVAAGTLGTNLALAESKGVDTDPHVVIGDFAGNRVYRDGTAGNAGTGSLLDLSTLNVLSFGARVYSVTSNYLAGKFYGAVAITRQMTATERTTVNRWLRGKFGASGSFLAVGDSHTFNSSFGLVEADFYPRKLSSLLGGARIALNYGISGNTTGNMVARLSDVTEAGAPDFAVIYGSTNDTSAETTVQASPAPTATAFTVSAGVGARYGAGALITVNGVSAEVASVATDRITVTAPLGFTPAAGQAVALRTEANLVKIGQALQATGCTRLVIPGLHYYNFASGLGDTTATPRPGAASLRAAQQGAADTLGAVYVDLYAWMRDLIVAGTYAQGDDAAWHVAVGNAHLNSTGEQILADAIFAAMQAQGWA